ncbi:MAG TPA: FAD-binding oxidoreductase [Fimbriimonadaceae bacterium]|nr:FAD-binding oxidoreductase [Fimbriimonadaceae bacterium]HRJ96354.1 FAD-binding oxidoreductase [Fimbriimonadaceae bacterium]
MCSRSSEGLRVILPPERIDRRTGFGLTGGADAFAYRPTTVTEIADLLALARRSGRKVVLRGKGRSYGDAAYLAEAVMIDLTRFDRILSWDPASGRLEVEAGVTLGDAWRHTLEDGWWPPVVSGTMHVTMGGALAMNIHGKNHFAVGSLAEYVDEIDLLTADGAVQTLYPGREDGLFEAVIGSAGLLGVITRAVLRMKRLHSGDLRVLPLSCASWAEQFAAFDSLLDSTCPPDYLVSWVDAFARGTAAGRGLIHAAWYTDEAGARPASLTLAHQELPDTILGFLPKSRMWRHMRCLNHRLGMRMVNAAKYRSSRLLGIGKPHPQSLAEFSFLLDYVPNWEWAYLPGGLIQHQAFVPRDAAPKIFARQLAMCRATKQEPFLAVLKRHRPDPFLLTWALDGYSLALDFKVVPGRWPRLLNLCHQMNDLVLEHGGRFYFAKDSTLRPDDVRSYLGEAALNRFLALRSELDPEGLFATSLARRLELV